MAKTVHVKLLDGLMFPSGFISQASYTCNIFARVPDDWTEGDDLNSDKLEMIYEALYGKTWRGGNDDGSRFVVIEAKSRVMSDADVQAAQLGTLHTTRENQYWFYKVSETGKLEKADAASF